jgi:hypothetical protein
VDVRKFRRPVADLTTRTETEDGFSQLDYRLKPRGNRTYLSHERDTVHVVAAPKGPRCRTATSFGGAGAAASDPVQLRCLAFRRSTAQTTPPTPASAFGVRTRGTAPTCEAHAWLTTVSSHNAPNTLRPKQTKDQDRSKWNHHRSPQTQTLYNELSPNSPPQDAPTPTLASPTPRQHPSPQKKPYHRRQTGIPTKSQKAPMLVKRNPTKLDQEKPAPWGAWEARPPKISEAAYVRAFREHRPPAE